MARKKVIQPPIRRHPRPNKRTALRPGIVQTILDQYKKATEAKPVTKDKILKVLVKKFPDRDEQAMKRTVSYSTHWFTDKKNYKVNTDGYKLNYNEKGYWAEAL